MSGYDTKKTRRAIGEKLLPRCNAGRSFSAARRRKEEKRRRLAALEPGGKSSFFPGRAGVRVKLAAGFPAADVFIKSFLQIKLES